MHKLVYLLFLVVCTSCASNTDDNDKPINDPIATSESSYLPKLIAKYPDSAALVGQWIDTLASQGQYEAAAGWCDSLIIQGAAINSNIYLLKGDLLRQAKKYNDALIAYDSFLTYNTLNEDGWLNKLNTMAEAGMPQTISATQKLSQKFNQKNTRSVLTYINGVYYNQNKQYDSARIWLDSSISLNYNYTPAYMEKGYSYWQQGQFEHAAATYEHLVGFQVAYAEGWYWLARCLDTLGKTSQAKENYEKALKFDPSLNEAHEKIIQLQHNK